MRSGLRPRRPPGLLTARSPTPVSNRQEPDRRLRVYLHPTPSSPCTTSAARLEAEAARSSSSGKSSGVVRRGGTFRWNGSPAGGVRFPGISIDMPVNDLKRPRRFMYDHRLGDEAPDFSPRRPTGDSTSTPGSREVGGAVLAPEGLHAGLHDRARGRGQAEPEFDSGGTKGHRPVGRTRSSPTSAGRPTSRTPGFKLNFRSVADSDARSPTSYGMIHPTPTTLHGPVGVRGRARHKSSSR